MKKDDNINLDNLLNDNFLENFSSDVKDLVKGVLSEIAVSAFKEVKKNLEDTLFKNGMKLEDEKIKNLIVKMIMEEQMKGYNDGYLVALNDVEISAKMFEKMGPKGPLQNDVSRN